MAVENALAVYNKGVSKIKAKKMLLSNLGNFALDMRRAFIYAVNQIKLSVKLYW